MPDGGWNCERDRGAVHSSFHTTFNVLEGLRAYADGDGSLAQDVMIAEARAISSSRTVSTARTAPARRFARR
jgi:hypothetical protein